MLVYTPPISIAVCLLSALGILFYFIFFLNSRHFEAYLSLSFSFLSPTQKMDNFFVLLSKREEKRNRQRKNESRTLTNDFFLFFLAHLFFWRKYIYIPHSSALKEEEEDHQEIKRGERYFTIFPMGGKKSVSSVCVCVLSLFC